MCLLYLGHYECPHMHVVWFAIEHTSFVSYAGVVTGDYF